jgi:cytochrome c oxidase subunit 2
MNFLLPANHAATAGAIDALFNWMCWIVLAAFLVVHGALVVCLIRFSGKTAVARPSAGNLRLELLWTAIPTVILLALALASARVWDAYRYAPDEKDVAQILVIGQQFRWNIIYPGPDGKLGRYLKFPKPTDAAWPHAPGTPPQPFMGVAGPAMLPHPQALAAINAFISQPDVENQLGKDWSDPAGADDDFADAQARPLYLPAGRPVKLIVMSRDVIHDVYLPNFRVQVYAVPGMVNSVSFTPAIPQEPAGQAADPMGLICNQLCGIGHQQMHTPVVILSQAEYHRRFESP